jgi:WD40 repeat protein
MKELKQFACPGSASSLAYSPNGTLIAYRLNDDTVRLQDIRSAAEITIKGHSIQSGAVAFSSDGRLLVSANDWTVNVWDVHSQEERFALEGHSDWVTSLAFLPNRSILASASADKTVKLWDADAGNELRTLGHSRQRNSHRMVGSITLRATA